LVALAVWVAPAAIAVRVALVVPVERAAVPLAGWDWPPSVVLVARAVWGVTALMRLV
jgi:hypothetical protein